MEQLDRTPSLLKIYSIGEVIPHPGLVGTFEKEL